MTVAVVHMLASTDIFSRLWVTHGDNVLHCSVIADMMQGGEATGGVIRPQKTSMTLRHQNFRVVVLRDVGCFIVENEGREGKYVRKKGKNKAKQSRIGIKRNRKVFHNWYLGE